MIFDWAIRRCIGGGFSYAGQVCIHTQRIYVHESIFSSFTKLYVEKASKLKFGDPIDPSTDISSMIDETNAIRVETWVNEAVSYGAQILTGGRNRFIYEPPY